MAAGAESLMLAEPWVLHGYQEARLREFLEMLPLPAVGESFVLYSYSPNI